LGTAAFGAVDIKEQDGKVRVEINGELFTEYHHTTAAPHVYYYPVIGPGGLPMTRSWPMAEAPNEERDHPHHRSIWYSHGAVNGIDFWSETASHGNKPAKQPVGKIIHEKILEAKGGEKEGVISAQLKWEAPDGSVPLTSVQTLRVYDRPANERLFDIEVTLKAGEKDVILGDTKEGTMGMRIAESMRLKQPKGKTGEGHMLSSEGDKDGAVWGKRAAWVDYWGPVQGKTLGVAMMDHPKNPRHPTRWHARDYGLFAANPFAEHEMNKSQPKDAGDFKIPAGESVNFKYRFYLHEGDAAQAKVAERFQEFSSQAK
ncbi:MAG: hypothetical protein EOP84_31365, partial [Verrucomicrobiaceae bacterium]